MDTLDYRSYLELYDYLNQRGLTQGRSPSEYAQYYRQRYGDPTLSAGEKSNWLRESSVRANVALENSRIGQLLGDVGGNISEAFGFDRSVGQDVGETIPRQALNFAPLILGAAVGGPIGLGVGAVASGAAAGSDVYGETGSGIAGIISGSVNAAMPGVGRVGQKLVAPAVRRLASEGVDVLGTQVRNIVQKPVQEGLMELAGEVGLQTVVGELGGIASNTAVRMDIGKQNPVEAVSGAVSDFFTAENLFQTALGELPFFIGMDIPGKLHGVQAPDGTRLHNEVELERYKAFDEARIKVRDAVKSQGMEVPDDAIDAFIRSAVNDGFDVNLSAVKKPVGNYGDELPGPTVGSTPLLYGPVSSNVITMPPPPSTPAPTIFTPEQVGSPAPLPPVPVEATPVQQAPTEVPATVAAEPLDPFTAWQRLEEEQARTRQQAKAILSDRQTKQVEDATSIVTALGIDADEILNKDEDFFDAHTEVLEPVVATNASLRENFQKLSEVYEPREALARAVKSTISALPSEKQAELDAILTRPERMTAFGDLEKKGDVVGSKKTVSFDVIENYIGADVDLDTYAEDNASVMDQLASDRFEGRQWKDLTEREQFSVKEELEEAATEQKIDNVYRQLMGLARLGDDDLMVQALTGIVAKTEDSAHMERMKENLRRVLPYIFGATEVMQQNDQRLKQLRAQLEAKHGSAPSLTQLSKYVKAASKYFQEFYKQVGLEELYQQLPSKTEQAGKKQTAEILERQKIIQETLEKTPDEGESAAETVEGELRRTLRTAQDARPAVQGGPGRAKQLESQQAEIRAAVQLFSRMVDSAAARFGLDSEALWNSIYFAGDTIGDLELDSADGSYSPLTSDNENAQRHEQLVKHLIRLAPGASLSTVMHEGAHMYGMLLEAAALSGKADAQVVKDYNTFREFTGLKEGETWLSQVSDPDTAAAAEKFAEGFEKYLQKGKAPVPALDRLFQQIKEWLSEIFIFLKDDLSPEVSEAFGRLLTTPEEVGAAAEKSARVEKEIASAIESAEQRKGKGPKEYTEIRNDLPPPRDPNDILGGVVKPKVGEYVAQPKKERARKINNNSTQNDTKVLQPVFKEKKGRKLAQLLFELPAKKRAQDAAVQSANTSLENTSVNVETAAEMAYAESIGNIFVLMADPKVLPGIEFESDGFIPTKEWIEKITDYVTSIEDGEIKVNADGTVVAQDNPPVIETLDADSSVAQTVQRLFPGVVDKGAPIKRIKQIYVPTKQRRKGLGTKLYLEAMQGGEWFYNSQAWPDTHKVLRSMQQRGLIEYHGLNNDTSKDAGPHIKRITEAGKRFIAESSDKPNSKNSKRESVPDSAPQNEYEALEYYGRTGPSARLRAGDYVLMQEDGLSGTIYKFEGFDTLADGTKRPRFRSDGSVPESPELIELDYKGGNAGLAKIIQQSLDNGTAYVFTPEKYRALQRWKTNRPAGTPREQNIRPKPGLFKKSPISWAGSKDQFIHKLRSLYAPFKDKRLVEPFFGSGEVAMGLEAQNVLANDLNTGLINFHKQVASGVTYDLPYDKNKKEDFISARNRYNELMRNGVYNEETAKLFYFLNKTAFGAKYRTNKRGEFNASFATGNTGRLEDLKGASDLYPQQIEFLNKDYKQLKVKPDDFIYSDPPYDATDVRYQKEGFTWKDQVEHAEWLSKHPGPVVTQNAATPRIIELYTSLGFDVEIVSGKHSSAAGSKKVEEILATKNIEKAPPKGLFHRKRSPESAKRSVEADLKHLSASALSAGNAFRSHFIAAGNSPELANQKAARAAMIVQKLGVTPIKYGTLKGQDPNLRGLFSETEQLGRIAGLFLEKKSFASDMMLLGHETAHGLQMDYKAKRLKGARAAAFKKMETLANELDPLQRSIIIEEMVRAIVPEQLHEKSMRDFIFDTDDPNEFTATLMGIAAMTGSSPADHKKVKANLKFLPAEVENFVKGVHRDLFEYADAIAGQFENPQTAKRFRELANSLKRLLQTDPESARLDAQLNNLRLADPVAFGELLAQGEVPTAMEKALTLLFAKQYKRRVKDGTGPLGAGEEPNFIDRNFSAFWQLAKKYPQLQIIEDLARSYREHAHAWRTKVLAPFAVSVGASKVNDPEYKAFGAVHNNRQARVIFDRIRKEQNALKRPLTVVEMDAALRGVPRHLRDKVAALSMKFDKANLEAANAWRNLGRDRIAVAITAKLQGLYTAKAKAGGSKVPSVDKLDAMARNYVENQFDPSRPLATTDAEALLAMNDTFMKLKPKYDRMDNTLKENPGYSPESADGYLVFYTKKNGEKVRLSAATRSQHKKNRAQAHADPERDGSVSVQTPEADQSFGTIGIESRILEAYNDVERDAYEAMVESVSDPVLQEQMRKRYNPGEAINRWNTSKTFNKHMMQKRGNVDDKGTFDYMLANLKYLNTLPHFVAREYVNSRKALYLNDVALREHPNLVNLAAAHIENVVTPLAPIVGHLNNANFLYFLGLNPSSAILDLSQSIFVAAPNLIRAGMGIGESYRTLGTAAKEALLSWNGKSTGDKVLDRILKRAYEEGVIDQSAGQMFYDEMEHMQHSIHQLGTPENGIDLRKMAGDAWYYANKLSRVMYKNSSEFNGKVGLISGYKAAKKKNPKGTEDELYQAAKVFNQETNFGGGAAARPVFKDVDAVIGRNGRGVAYSLSHYVTSMYGLYLLRGREALGRIPGADRAAARRALGVMAGTQAVAGGAIGLPLVGSVFALINNILGVDVENDAKEWVRKNSSNPEAADNIMAGLFHGAGMFAGPLDVSARVGVGTVLGIDNYGTLGITDVMGPTVGIVDNIVRAKTKWSNGDISGGQAAINVLPTGVRRMLQATMDGGAVRGAQGKLVYQPQLDERLALGLGFQPRGLTQARTQARLNYEAGLARNAELKKWRNQLADVYDPSNPESALLIQREVMERQKDELSLDVSAELRNIARIVANRDLPDDPNRIGPKQGGRRQVSMPRMSEVDRFLYEKQVESTLNPTTRPPQQRDVMKYAMIDQVVQKYNSSVPEATAIVDLVSSGYPEDVAALSVLGISARNQGYSR